MRDWTPVEIEFLKEKSFLLKTDEIAKLLGRTKHSVKSKIENMIFKGQLLNRDGSKGHRNINNNSESKGRNKTKELNIIKESFNLKDDIKIKAKISTRQAEIIEGKIIQKTDFMIIVKAGNYPISFKYIDFYTKNCIVIQ
ncbi:hypothetical protein [Clostridium magnum]|uniref:Uncharacterized protein n=1 Tax=Clostridium magnum DSM 2767 TaxID=1121326 RepID=A0A162QLZ1_9CLOT|nr:hypothetical protein [Clostridium magnum]KZL88694.1 hypothetical protein CLMAG_59830 [Clostridium magnum DSM 2767]SHJ64146.1 hypothetical protein SAMN02745944_06276 [Clostridium magnum DSM 2767]